MVQLLNQQLFKLQLDSNNQINFKGKEKFTLKPDGDKLSVEKYCLSLLKESFKKLVPEYKFVQQYYVHQCRQFQLLITPYVQKHGEIGQLLMEAYLLRNQNKYVLKSSFTRILFGKQIMKSKFSKQFSIVINFQTGEVKIKRIVGSFFKFVQILSNSSDNQIVLKNFLRIYNGLIKYYQSQILPILKKVSQLNYEYNSQEESNEKIHFQQKMKELVKLLKISTVQRTVIKQKESFSKIMDYQKKQKQEIVKLQVNIDKSFAGLQKQLSLFGVLKPKQQVQQLKEVGVLNEIQKRIYSNILSDQSIKRAGAVQYQYVLNCIGLLKIQNKKFFISSGASSVIYKTTIRFQYVFSDDPKYWLQLNKQLKDNIVQKSIAIKQPKQKNLNQKIRHQNEIIHKMKGGYSIFLPKYYKIQSQQKNDTMNQNVLFMDYINGQTLTQYVNLHKMSLSLWSKLYLILNIIHGLRFITQYNIVHNDLKPGNILVVRQMLTKIIDFGQAYHPKICKSNYRPGFTLPYTAPQIFQEYLRFSQKVDVFSLGMIMYEILFDKKIFQISNQKLKNLYKEKTYLKKVFLAADNLKDYGKRQIIQILECLIFKCLSPNQEQRPCLNWLCIILKSLLQIYIQW